MSKHPVFGLSADTIQAVLEKLELKLYQPGENVIILGQCVDKMFLLVRGICEVYKKLHTNRLLYTSRIETGEFFGEVPAILNSPHKGNITCKNYCTLGELKLDDYKIIATIYPKLAERMQK